MGSHTQDSGPGEAMAGGNGAAAGTHHAPSIMDMASVLGRIQQLEKLNAELSSTITAKDGQLERLTEGKRAEMKTLLETTMARFLEDLQTRDSKTKEDLKEGLARLAQRGDESGVWEVMACASASHVEKVNELEKLRSEVNDFREKERQLQGGLFASEAARVKDPAQEHGKRKFDEISTSHTDNGVPNIFDEFTNTIMNMGGIQGRYTE